MVSGSGLSSFRNLRRIKLHGFFALSLGVLKTTELNILSADGMSYWADHQLERNTLLAERYRLTKKTA